MCKIYLLNERGPDLFGNEQLALNTTYYEILGSEMNPLLKNELDQNLKHLSNKRVLVYVHGLRTTQEDVLDELKILKEKVRQLKIKETTFQKWKRLLSYYLGFSDQACSPCLYDAIIGYSWPSYNHETYYYAAKRNARKCALKFSDHLAQLSEKVIKLDIVAHSMGNYLLFEALKNPTFSKIDHIYSLAAAISNKALLPTSDYYQILERCNQIFIYHSSNDFALNWPFYLAEISQRAMGLNGPEKISEKLWHPKIKSIDAAQVISTHSDYLQCDHFYKHMQKLHHLEIDLKKSHFSLNKI